MSDADDKRAVEAQAESVRQERMDEVRRFAQVMSDASLPEPFAGMVTDAVRGWSNAISAAMWHQIRSELAVRQAEAEHAAYERVLRADASDPVVAQIVEQVTQRAMSKFIAIMARDAGVSDSVMAATVSALTGQPVPPSLQDEVFALLERAATSMTDDHPATNEQAS